MGIPWRTWGGCASRRGDSAAAFRSAASASGSELFGAYEAAGGGAVDAETVHYWEVFGNLKWAVICIMQAQRHLAGGTPSVELASLGRRTAEVEHELLTLVD